jgi:hypothetical protein
MSAPSGFEPPRRNVERERDDERFWNLVESALVYLGDDATNATYLPVSLRTSGREGNPTWRDLFDRGLVTGIEIVEAAAYRAKEKIR